MFLKRTKSLIKDLYASTAWGHQEVQGGARVPPAPKRVIQQQNNGPKPRFKMPKVCPDPNVKMPICQKNKVFGKIDLDNKGLDNL